MCNLIIIICATRNLVQMPMFILTTKPQYENLLYVLFVYNGKIIIGTNNMWNIFLWAVHIQQIDILALQLKISEPMLCKQQNCTESSRVKYQ